MFRYLFVAAFAICWLFAGGVDRKGIVVADSATRVPLPSASVFGSSGHAIGKTDSRGFLPFIPEGDYPVLVSYIGFEDKILETTPADTVFLTESIPELPEVLVETRARKVLHMLAYVREYSTLSTYSDTVTLFREKMVDFMIVPDRKMKFRGWTSPRLLTSRSYYRFTDGEGLDSVSDRFNNHFTWSDWMGIPPANAWPLGLRADTVGCDTIFGKYSPTEIWTLGEARTKVEVDVLADTTSRKWVPNLSGFFRQRLDFEKFKASYTYEVVPGDSLRPRNLAAYEFQIDSNGRGHDMFFFNRVDEPCFVSTRAEVYIVDREYIPVKEAKKWESGKLDIGGNIYEPLDAPPLESEIRSLVDRVINQDSDEIRLGFAPDRKLLGGHREPKNFRIGRRALSLLKTLTGVTRYKFHKNINRRWDELRTERKRVNASRTLPVAPASTE